MTPYTTHWSGILSLAYRVMFCLALLLVRSPQRIRSFAFTLMMSGVIQSAYGIIQALASSQETVASGSFVNRNHFAGYLEMKLAVGIGMLACGRRTDNEFSHWRDWLGSGSSFLLSEKAPLRIGIMIMALGLILSRSRMGNSAFMSTLTVVGLIYLLLSSGTFRVRLSLLWASILVLDVALLGSYFGLEKLADRIEATTTTEVGNRVDIGDHLQPYVRDFLPFGSGFGTFRRAFSAYYSEAMKEIYPHAENDYLRFAGELGVGSVALAIVVVAALVVALITVRRNDHLLNRGMAFAGIMAMVSLLIHSFVDFNLRIPANALLFVMMMALCWIGRYVPADQPRHRRVRRMREHLGDKSHATAIASVGGAVHDSASGSDSREGAASLTDAGLVDNGRCSKMSNRCPCGPLNWRVVKPLGWLGKRFSLNFGLGLALGLLALPAAASDGILSAQIPDSTFNYEASGTDNPYLRSTNFFGFDKPDLEDERWTDLLGDFKLPLFMNLGVSAIYDSNVIYNNAKKIGSFGSVLTPSFTIPMDMGKVTSFLNYSLRASLFEAVPDRNTIGNFLNASTTFDFNIRNRLTLTANGAFAQDPVGTLFSQGDVATQIRDPNAWSGYGFSGLYQYGAPDAEGNLNLNFDMRGREYTNNPDITRQRDMNNYNIGGAFLWRVMPKTQVVFEIEDSILDYRNLTNTGTSLNGSTYRFYTGATWAATAKTRAVAKVGYQLRTFDDPFYQDRSGPAFQGMLSWSPSSFDAVWLKVSNAFNEALIQGATSTITQTYVLNWRHQWLERLGTSLGAFYMDQQYIGNDVNNSLISGQLSTFYTFRPGITADLQYAYTQRFSNQSQFSFDKNLVLLSVRMLF